MRRYPYLMLRNGHYYFRIAIPTMLIKAMGRREILQSLKTSDYAEAKIRCAALTHVMEEIFKEAHKGRAIADTYLKECLKRLDFKHDSSASYSTLLSKLNVPVPIADKDAPEGSARKGKEDTVSDIFKRYIAECQNDRHKTILKKESVFRLWLQIIGDSPVNDLSKERAREFKQCLMRLPANLNKRFKDVPIREVLAKDIPEKHRLSITTINHTLAYMSTFVNWMINNGYYNASNPFSGLSLKDAERLEDKRHSFSTAQLQAIFNSPVYMGCKGDGMRDRYLAGDLIIKDSFYWIPLIALYSGARMQEICQLYVTDIKEINGIWIFDFNQDGEDKHLKTISSKRQTPIHPKLVEYGLLEYHKVQGNQLRLFPDLRKAGDGTYSNIFSKRFNYFLQSIKIKTNKTSFHSFRHTFIDGLRAAGISKEIREHLVGHTGSRTTHDNYGSSLGISVSYEAVTKVFFVY